MKNPIWIVRDESGVYAGVTQNKNNRVIGWRSDSDIKTDFEPFSLAGFRRAEFSWQD